MLSFWPSILILSLVQGVVVALPRALPPARLMPFRGARWALVPPLAVVSLIIIAPTIAALILVAWFGMETRGRDLRDLDPDGHTFAATGMSRMTPCRRRSSGT